MDTSPAMCLLEPVNDLYTRLIDNGDGWEWASFMLRTTHAGEQGPCGGWACSSSDPTRRSPPVGHGPTELLKAALGITNVGWRLLRYCLPCGRSKMEVVGGQRRGPAPVANTTEVKDWIPKMM